MEKKSKVVSKRLQKQLNELVSNKQYDEAIQLLEPIGMPMRNIKWGDCFTKK